ncbi:hypothetical protein PIB30_090142 [Stylosanthes scabra]|uniref:Pentatricopeptide repeat-containing protein n=1 Tax=Stylosanthes scabra TaxID=79078 RepID=A0ABU6UU99_9FABA|nr:hypothetical protein [Stylosanthes scabra]
MASVCCCVLAPSSSSSSPSISKFISDHPCLTMLQNHCSTMKDLKKLHAHMIKTGLVLDPIAASKVLTFCASPHGDTNYAYMVFTRMPKPTLFSWNTIIRCFSRSSTPQLAISIFIDIRVFDKKVELDVVAWNSMIMGLAKYGEIDESRRMFDEMPERTPVTWNSMISGYVRNGKLMEALELFREMQEEDVEPSEFTMVSLLNACAHLGALKHGKWIHHYIEKSSFELNLIVTTAIIDMYCKCGSIENAIEVFEASSTRGLSSWNSMIIGLAMNGHEREAIEYFSKLECSSLKPDSVSFIGVLTACKYLGAIDRAKHYFAQMMNEYEIEPSIKHYTCMVEVLGQAALLEEAEELIRDMPIEPDAIIWGSLLSSCAKHGNVEMAKRAAERVCELNPSDASGYVLMSNVQAASKQFEEAIEHRLLMKKSLTEKEPGCSSIELDGEVHEFLSGGRLHPKTQEIYYLLNDSSFTPED